MKLLDRPIVDSFGVVTVGEYGGWFVQIMAMIFNDRVVLAPMQDPHSLHYGWCFPKGGAAILAVMAWNPDDEAEPVGYIKAVNGKRRAGETVYERR
jgi:hypothetical protein